MTNELPPDFECRGAGPPLLFIHGLTFDRSTWDPIVDQLADRFTCIAVDLPGHGGSDGPPRPLDEVAAAISKLVAQLEVEPPVAVGHSMGAAIADIYAAHHPAGGLVMVDQAPYVVPFATMIQQIEGALRNDFRPSFEPIRQTIGVELLPEPQRTSILARQRIDPDLVLGFWSEVLNTAPDELQARIDRDLKAIVVPVLALFGHVTDPATREHLHSMLPEAQIEEWDGLGHMMHLMEPERFARRLADFARRCFSET
jgi:pimeloyl-ACP methyl ester carboxylesterase